MAKKQQHKDDKLHALDEVAKDILERSVKDGKIDQKDIFKEIPELPENLEVLDKLYADMSEAERELSGLYDQNPKR